MNETIRRTPRVLPNPPVVRDALERMARRIEGDVRADDVTRALYSTDASIYELVPVGVAMPRSRNDVLAIVDVCREAGIPITPRTAGTSLAGQAVGPGLVADVGRYLCAVQEPDVAARTVRVEPGVIRDELNRRLRPIGLHFGPDTSTSNRCMIGGMIGNNSCGSHSILYGTTRENVRWIDVVLEDASLVRLERMTREAWAAAETAGGRFGAILRVLREVAGGHAAAIRAAYPREDCVRRNTGFPLDDLANSWLGDNPERDPDLARFFCGTEGTLGIAVEAELLLHPVPVRNVVVAAHFETIDESLRATVEAVAHRPAAVELMDRRVLELAALNPEQARNRHFVEGDPGALLVIEFYGETVEELDARCAALVDRLREAGLGYAFPVIHPPRIGDVWALRAAGLGVLSGKPGDVKPVTLVEDTAVPVDLLPAFIREFARVMDEHETECVYYAHASVGELHMRPELNLKDAGDVAKASSIAVAVADLVRKYRGALSGEHGDGRLRSPYLERVLGADIMKLHADVKTAFDPRGLFNPGNIVAPAPMEADWRYHEEYRDVPLETEFGWTAQGGLQRAVESCNGTGVCRRPHTQGGTMCPSYMVTLEERETTRGRANLFRRLIQEGPDALWTSDALHDALDLCLSCKGCRSDCPASVDMARMKAEFTQAWMDRRGRTLSGWFFAHLTELGRWAQRVPGGVWLATWLQRFGPTRAIANRLLSLAPARALPAFARRSFHDDFPRGVAEAVGGEALGTVILFVDEFTDRLEPELAHAAVELLTRGGYRVVAPRCGPSGRAMLSKGYVRDARAAIERNVALLRATLAAQGAEAIVGVEPSALLTYTDESLDLPRDADMRAAAAEVAAKVELLEDFVAARADVGRWRARFTQASRTVVLHGHCHQKASVGMAGMRRALALPPNYRVEVLATGCCGMAGSFGYEAKHYDVSMGVGELVLFPAVRGAAADAIIAAPGTSCRHQIADGTGRVAAHPIVVLRDALEAE